MRLVSESLLKMVEGTEKSRNASMIWIFGRFTESVWQGDDGDLDCPRNSPTLARICLIKSAYLSLRAVISILIWECGGAKSSMCRCFWNNSAPPSDDCSDVVEDNATPPASDSVSDFDSKVIVPIAFETMEISLFEALAKASNIRTKLTASSQSVSGPEIVKTLFRPPSCKVEAMLKVVSTDRFEGTRMLIPLLSQLLEL